MLKVTFQNGDEVKCDYIEIDKYGNLELRMESGVLNEKAHVSYADRIERIE